MSRWDVGDDPCEIWTDLVRRAKKAHRCQECNRQIDAGEHYRAMTGTTPNEKDGFFAYKACMHCYKVTTWLGKLEVWPGLGDALSELEEELSNKGAYEFAVYRAAAGMRRGWRIKRGPSAGSLMALPELPEYPEVPFHSEWTNG